VSRRVMIYVVASMAAVLARESARGSAPVHRIERVTHDIDAPKYTYAGRDHLPYGKKARRAQRGGRHV